MQSLSKCINGLFALVDIQAQTYAVFHLKLVSSKLAAKLTIIDYSLIVFYSPVKDILTLFFNLKTNKIYRF